MTTTFTVSYNVFFILTVKPDVAPLSLNSGLIFLLHDIDIINNLIFITRNYVILVLKIVRPLGDKHHLSASVAVNPLLDLLINKNDQ